MVTYYRLTLENMESVRESLGNEKEKKKKKKRKTCFVTNPYFPFRIF